MACLEVDHLSKQYPTLAEPLTVLRDVSFSLEPGRNIAVVGPSGSGKSTLLHILGTLDKPSSGQLRLNGQDPFSLSESDLAAYRNQNVGFIFQEHYLLPQLSVLENVLVPALAERRPGADLVERAKGLIERVGLSQRIGHRPAELSGGERQRVAVARALIMNPMLLLADEPTGSLDRKNAVSVAELLTQLQREESRMLVVVTHSQEIAGMMQRQLELNEGQLQEMSSP